MTWWRGSRTAGACAVLVYVMGLIVQLCVVLTPNRLAGPGRVAVVCVATVPTVWLGVLLIARRPGNPTGPALVWIGAGNMLAEGIQDWGGTHGTRAPWPASSLGAFLGQGAWVFNLTGFFLLCLVFPDGPLTGRRWRLLPWAALAVAGYVELLLGRNPAPQHPALVAVLIAIGVVGVLGVSAASIRALVVRRGRGDAMVRAQMRWLVLGAVLVPIALVAGWIANAAGAPSDLAFTGLMLMLLVVLPGAVTVAILRHDLFDIDRLLSDVASWTLTTLLAAALFAGLVASTTALGIGGTPIGPTAAAFLVALVLLPVHRLIRRTVGRVVDRDRTVARETVHAFVRRVRDGVAEPEAVEDVLRSLIGNPSFRLLLRVAEEAEGSVLAGLDGASVEPSSAATSVPLRSSGSDIGIALLDSPSARELRRTRELLADAWTPIELTRSRLGLRFALDDARDSRARLVHSAASERRRLERDLHDGAQPRIVAVGMRLRSIQRTQVVSPETRAELDAAVDALAEVVADLRRLAHGLRPSRLDDGLATALQNLVSDWPIDVTLDVADEQVPETIATTAYFVIAEGLANTLKHAAATRASASFARVGDRHVVEVRDDGMGGIRGGLTALHDRVEALGGHLDVFSQPGNGTILRAEF